MANRRRKRARAKGRGERGARQGELAFPVGRGGKRAGAGRKALDGRKRVPHRVRAVLAARFPVHVTMRVREGLPTMRSLGAYEVLRDRLVAGCERFGFRLVEYSVQSNHIHLVVEAKNARALARGMQGLAVRIARGLNKLWDRTGKLFADRYHSRILRTPTEVRRALAYVLNNARRHGVSIQANAADIHSSGPWFTGWKDLAPRTAHALPLAVARSWLLRAGWRLRGLIPVGFVPGPRPDG